MGFSHGLRLNYIVRNDIALRLEICGSLQEILLRQSQRGNFKRQLLIPNHNTDEHIECRGWIHADICAESIEPPLHIRVNPYTEG
jgi:hypothetical protein